MNLDLKTGPPSVNVLRASLLRYEINCTVNKKGVMKHV